MGTSHRELGWRAVMGGHGTGVWDWGTLTPGGVGMGSGMGCRTLSGSAAEGLGQGTMPGEAVVRGAGVGGTDEGNPRLWHGGQSRAGPAVPCRVSPSGDPARRILAAALPFQRLNLPLRAMLCQVEKSQNKAARSTKTPPVLRGASGENRLGWGTGSDTHTCGGICSHLIPADRRSDPTRSRLSPRRAECPGAPGGPQGQRHSGRCGGNGGWAGRGEGSASWK